MLFCPSYCKIMALVEVELRALLEFEGRYLKKQVIYNILTLQLRKSHCNEISVHTESKRTSCRDIQNLLFLTCLFKKKHLKIFLTTYFSCSRITSWSSAPQVTLVCSCYDFCACVALRSPNRYTALYWNT